ncbi:DUF4249 family protein [Aquimarina sp. MMG016]|uniref:DUF4249 family protein n=1 Tax=Aquimarina sp. MMG016 TaxID=2822690 RepID=UPI001B3A6EAB|nr:DUF4249 family protein [Aquimarina sp. MMG016]MBQ4820748.1 DUF4249 family protein [Aquimarina sp. MMG016]
MKKLHIYLIVISLSSFISCVDEITPDFEFEEQVFISGLMTDKEDFVSVQIQKTVPVTDTTVSIVNDAQISLYTRDASNTVSLVSDSFAVTDGIYTTTEVITPVTGNTYWIEVMLQDQTMYRSEEEILKPPIPILDLVKIDNTVRITFRDQLGEQNFYLGRIEILRNGTLLTNELLVFNDTIITDDLEESLEISIVNDGDTVRVSAYTINFNTFQFYSNILGEDRDNLDISSLFSPINIVGNITNTTTNKLALGNFGVAGFSTMTMDF